MTEHERIFPFLQDLDKIGLREFEQVAVRVTLPPERFICSEGELCSQVPLLLSGCARVYKTSESGRQITLYRIEPGESCILTASCVLSGALFPAFAVTEEVCEALVVPSETFAAWVNRYRPWRDFVFDLLSRRFASVVEVVEEVAFRHLDTRVASYLLETLSDGMEVRATHEKIASDLGSSREVISRVLKEFEREGLVALSRGAVAVRDPTGLSERRS